MNPGGADRPGEQCPRAEAPSPWPERRAKRGSAQDPWHPDGIAA